MTGLGDPDGDDRGDLDHAPTLPDLVERGVQPDVGVLALDGASEERAASARATNSR